MQARDKYQSLESLVRISSKDKDESKSSSMRKNHLDFEGIKSLFIRKKEETQEDKRKRALIEKLAMEANEAELIQAKEKYDTLLNKFREIQRNKTEYKKIEFHSNKELNYFAIKYSLLVTTLGNDIFKIGDLLDKVQQEEKIRRDEEKEEHVLKLMFNSLNESEGDQEIDVIKGPLQLYQPCLVKANYKNFYTQNKFNNVKGLAKYEETIKNLLILQHTQSKRFPNLDEALSLENKNK